MADTRQAEQRFGRELAKARKLADFTQAALARAVGVSASHISHLERGIRAPNPVLLLKLDEELGTSGRLSRLWSELTGSVRDAWVDEIAALTRDADALFEYQSLVFPAYLQTEEYAWALIRYGAPWKSKEEAATLSAERAARARDMAEAASPRLWVVLDQTIIARRYGSPSIARGQLARVAELVEQERLTLQLVPANSPRHPGNSGPFRVITASNSPDVVFMENAHEGQIITAPDEVSRRRMLFAALQGVALGPEETIRALQQEVKRLEHE